MLLGVLMILASAGFWGVNALEERQAGIAAEQAANILKKEIADARSGSQEIAAVRTGGLTEKAGTSGETDAAGPEGDKSTTAVLMSGDYMGILSLPDLGLELPVAAQWSYPALRKTPCRYSGSVEEENLVILAHNYERHFGGLKRLKPGARITFTSLDGGETVYEAVDIRTLGPDQAEEMLEGDWQLLLFTCTYGGENRVAVRCRKTNAQELSE